MSEQPANATTNPKILIVDDHAIVRQGLRLILAAESFDDILEAGNGLDVVAMLDQVQPDVVILDIALPGMRGIDVASEILKRYPETKIIFLTMHKDEEYVYQAMAIGASGYVLKECLDTEIITAIHTVQKGRNYLTPLISSEIMNTYSQSLRADGQQSPFSLLSNREREILTLLSEGRTNKQIADLLFISPRTVEHHRQNLMKKLDVSSIPELIKLAIKKKLIEF